jgi:hypothetical protein
MDKCEACNRVIFENLFNTYRLRINFPFRLFRFSLWTWATAALTWAEGKHTWAEGELCLSSAWAEPRHPEHAPEPACVL